MIADILEGILEAILGVFVFLAIVVLQLIRLVTLPVWIIPYTFWKSKKKERRCGVMAELTCYDCIHCDRCNDIEGGFSCHCSDVSKCKRFKNKADFVEVVRCKECVKRGMSGCPNLHFSDVIGDVDDLTEDNDYCSYGERSMGNGC